MTMLSFRVDEQVSAEATRWAGRLGIDRSELLRDALHAHLVRLAGEIEVAAWARAPRSDDERSLDEIADWGPAEDWADWADAAG